VSLVLDSSVALTWFYDDEVVPATEDIQNMVVAGGALVPAIWHLETANSLQMNVRRRRITESDRDAALTELASLAILVDPETIVRAWSDTLALSTRFRLTVYDAAYLELAHRRGLPLASLDGELRAAASTLGVDVLPTQA
jgi:predicted nucleic acid-binding protein